MTVKLSPPLPAPVPVPPPAPPPVHVDSPSRAPLYVALTIGGAGLATGAVSGGIALAQSSKLPTECPNFACSGPGSTTRSQAGTAADVSTAGFIVGGAGVAVAAIVWLLSPGKAPAALSGASPSFGPWVGLGGGGVSGTF